jgi:inorganic triphosphatase YgiF
MSLRAENKRLLKQASALFPSEEKETLERKIRHLENVIKTNETMQFETMQEVAQWFNYFEDVYEDGVWDRFINDHKKTYEIK